MGRAREVLLGRQAEIDLLEGELSEVSQGTSVFVLISGEAGIGKTRLLDELEGIADRAGFLTLRGRAAELDSERPFGLFVDALDAYVASLDSPALSSLVTDRLGALAAVFPSLHGLGDAVDHPASVTERFRAHHAVRELLERLAARRPLLLVLDDLHWADGASLELASYLIRNPPRGEVLVVAAMRPSMAGAGPQAALGRLDVSNVTTIELKPLEEASVRELIGDTEKPDVEELLRLSGGNPFYALQLARIGIDKSGVGDPELHVPPSVAAAIAVELGRLAPPARRIADAAAVAGDPFDLDMAVAAADVSEEEVLQQIDVLLARDLVRETDLPRRFQFRHPIVHRAVYGSCPPSVKVSGHRRVVAELTRRGAPAIARAHHVEQSASHGDMVAVDTMRQAAAEAADSAPTSSVRWLLTAIRLLPGRAPVATRVELLNELARSQGALGRFADAHETLAHCIEVISAAGEEVPVELTVRCAEMEQLLGHHGESKSRLESAFDDLEDTRSRAGVSLLVALAAASLYLSDHEGMLESGRLAVSAAGELGDDAMLAAALAAHTLGAAFAGDESLAIELHDRCSKLLDSLPDEVVVTRLDSLSNLATAELYLDRHVLGCIHGRRALELARGVGQAHFLPTLTPILGMSLAMTGDLEASAQVLDDAIEAARLVGDAQGLSMNLFNRSLSAVMAGDVERALDLGAESLDLARSVDNGVITAFAGAIYAQALYESGDAGAAIGMLLESVGGVEIPLLAGSWRAHFLELLTRCSLATGQPEMAQDAVARLRDQAADHGLGLTRLMADRAAAEVALFEGRHLDAVDLAGEAVSEAERIEARVHLATSRQLLGRALVEADQLDEAGAQLEMAAEDFHVLGATRYRNQVEMELRRLGRPTTHRRTTPGRGDGLGLESLTGRELEVAELVLDRRTNREIAEELFLSTKTVETHLRNIFNKLGVTSRVEVARVLARSDRLPTHATGSRVVH